MEQKNLPLVKEEEGKISVSAVKSNSFALKRKQCWILCVSMLSTKSLAKRRGKLFSTFPVALETPLWVLSFAIFIFARGCLYQTPSLYEEEKNKWLIAEGLVCACVCAFGIRINWFGTLQRASVCVLCNKTWYHREATFSSTPRVI